MRRPAVFCWQFRPGGAAAALVPRLLRRSRPVRGGDSMKRMLLVLGLAAPFCACGSRSSTSPSDNQNMALFAANLLASNEAPPIAGAEANARGAATITFNMSRD